MGSAICIPRPAIRLADPKLFRKLILSNTRSLHQQHPTIYPFSRNLVSAAPTSAPASQFLIRATVVGFRTRSFASTGSNHTWRPRSADDRRHQRVVPNRPLLGTARDGLPGKGRKPIPFLLFRASSFADALVHTIVGIGISGSCMYEHVESNEAEWALLQFSLQELRTWGGTN